MTADEAEDMIRRGICPIEPYVDEKVCTDPCYCRIASRAELEDKGLLPRWIADLGSEYQSVLICLKDEDLLTPLAG
jgi:hypothetical protein